MKDKLELLFWMQTKFQNRFGYHPELKDVATALMDEGGELLETALATLIVKHSGKLWKKSGGKWWSKKIYSKGNKLEELVDILHFYLVYCIALGVTPQELFDEYSKKLAENYRRQKVGY